MRVISQDGTIDMPYEISSLSMAVGKYEDVEHAAIYCHNSSTAMGTKMAEKHTLVCRFFFKMLKLQKMW